MPTEQFANNAQSSLTAAVAAGDTSLTVANASAFPASGNFRVLIDAEILLVTAVSGNTFTVTRGAEGTAAAAHVNGAYVTHVVTAAALLNCPRAMTAAGDLEYLAASGAVTRRAIGSAGQVLTVAGGLPTWANGTDMLAALVNAPNLITNADANLTSATWNVVKATVAAHTVTLPAPSAGLVVGVRVTPDSTKLVTLGRHSTDLIDGQASRLLWAGEKAVLLSDGTDWFKVTGVSRPMQAALSLSSANQLYNSAGTYLQVALDTVVADNTGLCADTTNHRLNVQRTGLYVCAGYITFDPNNGAQTSWGGTSGTEADILNNASAGGAVWTSGKGLVVSGALADVVPVAAGAFALTAGQFIALQGYMGNAIGNFNAGAAGTNCGLSFVEVPSW